MSRTCEMAGCVSPADQLYSLVPGTTLWLCKSCAETDGFEGATMNEVTTERRNCSHHWVIQPANGSVSLGVCRFCRETRKFRN